MVIIKISMGKMALFSFLEVGICCDNVTQCTSLAGHSCHILFHCYRPTFHNGFCWVSQCHILIQMCFSGRHWLHCTRCAWHVIAVYTALQGKWKIYHAQRGPISCISGYIHIYIYMWVSECVWAWTVCRLSLTTWWPAVYYVLVFLDFLLYEL